ncbi:hypothetical protein EHQ52_18470 [Leptospira koniambonensis]|uniref:Lipoprotein n=1 Tax=Leptospira koniambonensis TaxID=2484950 RepID=A0A4R9J1H6_9LEPT|nr:hypothetical protein [Leptospira koniambonensis]TGL28254.1 hypothetical protein EHQ52_18470 [Leptospira koniambonensis]
MKYIKIIMLLSIAGLALGNCSKSPEQKVMELAPRLQLALCSKMLECGKDEIEKIPPQYRSSLPPFMQSQEACVSYFKESFDKAREQRKERKEEVTPEMVQSFETCVIELEKASCEPFKNGRGKRLGIPGCENLTKIGQPESP